MRKAHRPMGRFFCLLMVAAATLGRVQSGGPAMTQVADTVYRTDGTPATGTVLISWPAFTTVDGKAVAAGSMSVHLGSGGRLRRAWPQTRGRILLACTTEWYISSRATR